MLKEGFYCIVFIYFLFFSFFSLAFFNLIFYIIATNSEMQFAFMTCYFKLQYAIFFFMSQQ